MSVIEKAKRACAIRKGEAYEEKAKRLLEAAGKPLRTLLQYDGWANAGGDPICDSGDGYGTTGGMTREFQRGDYPVRVLVHPSAKHADVMVLLERIQDWIKSLADEWGHETYMPDLPADDAYAVLKAAAECPPARIKAMVNAVTRKIYEEFPDIDHKVVKRMLAKEVQDYDFAEEDILF